MRRVNIRSTLSASMFFVAMAFAGCSVDFENVKTLGDHWDDVMMASEEIGEDLYQSCLRRSNFPEAPPKDVLQIFPQIARGQELENGLRGKIGADEVCVSEVRPRMLRVIDANNVLVSYLQRLSEIADPNTGAITDQDRANLSRSITGLRDTLVGLREEMPAGMESNDELTERILTDQNIASISSLFGRIFTAFQNQVRSKTIPVVMVCTDSSIRDYTRGLELLARDEYGAWLESEKEVLTDFYLSSSNLPEGPLPEPGTHDATSLQYIADIDAISARQEKGRQYGDLLVAIAKMHNEISKVFAENLELDLDNPHEIESFCMEEINALASHLPSELETGEVSRDIASLSEQLDLSQSQMLEIAGILQDYRNIAEPLLEGLTSNQN